MRPLLFVLPVLLAACVAAPAVNEPIYPAEAQRIIDHATATAAVAATHQANATATEQVSRATATAGRQQTQDALAVQQTQTILQVTVEAGHALATTEASARTQSALAIVLAGTPTAAALATHVADIAAERRQAEASAAAWRQFWQTLGDVILGAIQWSIIGLIALVALRVLSNVAFDFMREWAAIAKANVQIVPPKHWLEYHPVWGYYVRELPGALDEPPKVIENVEHAPDRYSGWRQSYRLHAWWGTLRGFGIRDLVPGVESDPDWRILTANFRAGNLTEERVIVREGKKVRVTTWKEGMNYETFSEAFQRGDIELPYPLDQDPPKVAYTIPVG